jgi:vacuolar-type H+-ATPase subunit E/Vma4
MSAVALQLVDAEKDPQYRVGLVEQTRQALRFADDRATLLRCRPSLVPLLQGLTAGGECVVAQPDPECEVGVLLTARDGSMQIDDTLPSRLRRLAAQLGPHFLAEVEK